MLNSSSFCFLCHNALLDEMSVVKHPRRGGHMGISNHHLIKTGACLLMDLFDLLLILLSPKSLSNRGRVSSPYNVDSMAIKVSIQLHMYPASDHLTI